MRIKLNILLILILLAFAGKAQTVLFSEDFGSTYSSTYLLTNWCSASSYSNSSSSACDGYSWYSYGSADYIKTNAISIPATGTTTLTFDYKFNQFSSYPVVSISTGGCYGTYTSVLTLSYNSTCYNESIDLSAYAGQSVNIQFYTYNSSGTFIIDNVQVENVSGGGGTTCSDVFTEDFGTTFSSTHLYTNWCSASSYSNSSSSACDGYSWYAYGSSDYVKTNTINIPATGTTTLYFDYKFNQFSSYPVVSISTGGCYGSYSSLLTLSYNSSCYTESIDLSVYAGQSVNIQFYTYNSSGTFILDNILVENCTSGGGSGTDVKWADTFSDGDTDLDFTGNDGDEDCSGASWTLVDGASVTSSGSYTVNRNETDAFNTTTDDVSGYGVLLDKNESLESPTIDLSAQESFKINFYVMKQGGSANWNSWTELHLEYWDGSAWQTLQTIKNNASATSSENDYFIESGFGYHCFTVYKSSTSPGNYYYSSGDHVNSACFHSDFKFRLILDEFMSSDYPQVYIDNITFRADDTGENLIPCGISYWNGADATYYGKDPEATSTFHAPRGVEVETDDLFSAMKGTPDWTGHFNDGNTGGNDLYEIMWAVVSEQKISTTYAKISFAYVDGTSPQSRTMTLDDAYSGPGFLYYYKEYADCDGSSGGSYNTGPGIVYHFYFEYGSDFRPVYFQLNSSGIEMGGGVTDFSENMNPVICNSVLPIEMISFDATVLEKAIELEWLTASEINCDYYIIQKSEDGKVFSDLGYVSGSGNSNIRVEYSFVDNKPLKGLSYYRIQQFDYDGTIGFSDVIPVEYIIDKPEVFPNPFDGDLLFFEAFEASPNAKIEILDISGKCVYSNKIDISIGKNKIKFFDKLSQGTYVVSISSVTGEMILRDKLIVTRP